MAATLFISYAHKDELCLDALLEHLGALHADGTVELWHDRRLLAGDAVFPNIEAALDRAQIVLLLVSESFLASHECQREMWRALRNRVRRGVDVVPVILHACGWRAAPLGQLSALPIDGAPIFSAPNRAAACQDVVDGVRRLVDHRVRRARTARRRRYAFAAALMAAAVALGASLFHARLPRAARQPSELVMPRGALVVAEFSAVAPDGAAWNATASGKERLPNLVFCFRHDEMPETEICQPAALGARDGRPSFYAHRTHVAEPLSGMRAWSRTFSVDVGDRHPDFVRRIGRGRCRFGTPCELAADDATVVGELLVLPAEETGDASLLAYLNRCVDPQSRLVRDWLLFAVAAGSASPDLGRMSQRNLARAFTALASVELPSGLIDAAIARRPAAFAALPARNATRAALFRAAAGDDTRTPDRAEIRAALTVLHETVGAASVDADESCR